MKVEQYYNLDLQNLVDEIITKNPMPSTLAKSGNQKVGKGIGMISSFPLHTCPGKTEWCSSKCYAVKGNIRLISANPNRPNGMRGYVKDAWYVHLANNDPKKLTTLLRDTFNYSGYSIYRNFPEGDWFSENQIKAHYDAAKSTPCVKHFFYTRSWRTPLLDSLNLLLTLPNVKGFASVDEDARGIPKDWLQATILSFTKDSSKRVICPEQMQQVPNCLRCGLCFNKQVQRHIVFFDHSDPLYKQIKQAAKIGDYVKLKELQQLANQKLKEASIDN